MTSLVLNWWSAAAGRSSDRMRSGFVIGAHSSNTHSLTMPTIFDNSTTDDLIAAARAIVTATPSGDLPEKQRPLVPLLAALLDAAQAVANAIADNAWDDSLPLPQDTAESLVTHCYRLGADIHNATQCPDRRRWATAAAVGDYLQLPSMSGKELV